MYLNFRFQAHAWRNKYYFFKEYSSFQKGLRLGLISRPDQTSVAPEATCTFPPYWCFPFTHSPFLTEPLLSPDRRPTCSWPQGPHSADPPSAWGSHGGGVRIRGGPHHSLKSTMAASADIGAKPLQWVPPASPTPNSPRLSVTFKLNVHNFKIH